METKERYFINHSGELLDETMPLRDTDITDRLNEQDDDITRYRARIAALEAENTTLRTFARALLARLSYDYGDSEDCPAEVEKLFEIGEELFPTVDGAAQRRIHDLFYQKLAAQEPNHPWLKNREV